MEPKFLVLFYYMIRGPDILVLSKAETAFAKGFAKTEISGPHIIFTTQA